MVDSVEGLSADDIPDLLPSLPKNQAEGLSSLFYCICQVAKIFVILQLSQKPSTH